MTSPNILDPSARISAVKETLLGTVFLDDRLWRLSIGNITDDMVQEYLEHHRHPSNKDNGNMILE